MNGADFIRLVDSLEERAAGYLTVSEVEAAANEDLTWAIENGLLLVDHRTCLDGSSVTLCRLNRRHPTVARLTAW